jgi:hypothetical protein
MNFDQSPQNSKNSGQEMFKFFTGTGTLPVEPKISVCDRDVDRRERAT